jgi:hypothetical protein
MACAYLFTFMTVEKNKPRLKLSFSYYTAQITSDTWCVGVSLHTQTSKQAILNKCAL